MPPCTGMDAMRAWVRASQDAGLDDVGVDLPDLKKKVETARSALGRYQSRYEGAKKLEEAARGVMDKIGHVEELLKECRTVLPGPDGAGRDVVETALQAVAEAKVHFEKRWQARAEALAARRRTVNALEDAVPPACGRPTCPICLVRAALFTTGCGHVFCDGCFPGDRCHICRDHVDCKVRLFFS